MKFNYWFAELFALLHIVKRIIKGGLTAGSDIVFAPGDDFTIEVIAMPPQNTINGHNEGGLVGRGRYSSTDQYNLYVYNDGAGQPNTVGAFVANAGVGNHNSLDDRHNPPTAGWHHVAMVRDRTNDKLRLYIDGSLAKEGIDPAGALDVDDTGTHNLIVGGNFFDTGAGAIQRPYQGTLDFVRISNTALAPEDFQMVDPVPEPGSLALLLMGVLGLLVRRRRG